MKRSEADKRSETTKRNNALLAAGVEIDSEGTWATYRGVRIKLGRCTRWDAASKGFVVRVLQANGLSYEDAATLRAALKQPSTPRDAKKARRDARKDGSSTPEQLGAARPHRRQATGPANGR